MCHDFQAISPPFVLFLLWPSGSCVYSLIILITTKYYLFHFLPMYFPPHQHAEPVLTSLEPIKPVHFPRQYFLEKIMKRSQRSYHDHPRLKKEYMSPGLTRSNISSIVIMIIIVIIIFMVIMMGCVQNPICIKSHMGFCASIWDSTHFQVTLSVFIATDCFMWGCPQNHQATIQGRQRQKASQTP